MQFHMCFVAVCLLQWTLLGTAQQKGRPSSDNPSSDDDGSGRPEVPQAPNNADEGNTDPKAPVPGALAVGSKQYPTEEDEHTDLGEIAEKLLDLIEKIKDLDDITMTTTSSVKSGSSTRVIVTSTPDVITRPALPCVTAQANYASCSQSFTNFTALPRTEQAGCICNALSGIDFDQQMLGCYSFIQNRTQYASYTSAIANGTAVCASTSDPGLASALPSSTSTSTPRITSNTAMPSSGKRRVDTRNGGHIVLIASGLLLIVLSLML